MECVNYCIFDGKVVQISKIEQFVDKRKSMTAICRYILAVPRPNCNGYDYIFFLLFGNRAWYAHRHIKKGMWLTVEGHMHSTISMKEHFNLSASLTVHYQKNRWSNERSKHRNYEKMETET